MSCNRLPSATSLVLYIEIMLWIVLYTVSALSLGTFLLEQHAVCSAHHTGMRCDYEDGGCILVDAGFCSLEQPVSEACKACGRKLARGAKNPSGMSVSLKGLYNTGNLVCHVTGLSSPDKTPK